MQHEQLVEVVGRRRAATRADPLRRRGVPVEDEAKRQLVRVLGMLPKTAKANILAFGDDCKALTLKPALEAAKAASFRFETIESDHSFNDRRIALAGTVLSWLDSLPH